MKPLNLNNIADRVGRLRCPDCGCTLLEESIPGKPGEQWLRLTCTDMADAHCHWRQTVAIDAATGHGRVVDQPRADRPIVDVRWSEQSEKAWDKLDAREKQRRRPLPGNDQAPPKRKDEARMTNDEAKAAPTATAPLTTAPLTTAPATPTKEGPTTMPRKNAQPATCRVAVCDGDTKARGLCSTHLSRWYTAEKPDVDTFIAEQGELDAASIKTTPTEHCRVAGCEKKHLARGLCGMHWKRWDTAGKPDLEDFIIDQGLLPVDAPTDTPEPASETAKPETPTPAVAADPSEGVDWNEDRAPTSEPAAAAPAAPPAKPAANTEPAPSADGFQLVAFGKSVSQAWIGVLGDYLTVTEADGRLLAQVRVVDMSASTPLGDI